MTENRKLVIEAVLRGHLSERKAAKSLKVKRSKIQALIKEYARGKLTHEVLARSYQETGHP